MTPLNLASITNKKYIYLTTVGRRTGNPHTVELWFALVGKRIFLSHEGVYTDWMKNIVKNPCVKFRIGDTTLTGVAHIVRDGKAFEKGKHALYLKYYGKTSKDVIDDWFSESTILEIKIEER